MQKRFCYRRDVFHLAKPLTHLYGYRSACSAPAAAQLKQVHIRVEVLVFAGIRGGHTHLSVGL